MKIGRTGYRAGMDVRSLALPAAAALVSALLAGCGSDDELITSTTADSLHAQVRAVREAVADGQTGRAESAVTNLRNDLRRLADAGELDPADALVLLTQVDRIAAGLEPAATPTPTPTPTPRPASSGSSGSTGGNGEESPGNGKPKGKPSDNGKGKGKGKKK